MILVRRGAGAGAVILVSVVREVAQIYLREVQLPKDNSWATQVGKLREDNDHKHQNHLDALHNSMPNEKEDEMQIHAIV
eukprot:14467376-Ditylum_brightwellii.AAC.1